MKLGAFSVSLSVKDLEASKAFYEKLGFNKMGGDASQGWLILKNESKVIGLFQGMFEKNMMTFNPGWDGNAQPLQDYDDIREIQKRLKADDIEFMTEVDEGTSGPASFMILDPDGNPILVDQHL